MRFLPILRSLILKMLQFRVSFQVNQGDKNEKNKKVIKAGINQFDLAALGQRGQPYERLDQLVVELLLGVR